MSLFLRLSMKGFSIDVTTVYNIVGIWKPLYNARTAQTPWHHCEGAAHPLGTSASVPARGTHGVGWEGLH